MRLGEVRVAEDQDFRQLVALADNHDGWKLDFCNNSTKVWTKQPDEKECKMMKASTTYTDVDAATVYDVIHDVDYTKHYDKSMLAIDTGGCLNPNNQIFYYAMACPSPLCNRDLVVLRSWLDTGREYYSLGHSVSHQQFPPRKGFVRALNYLSGYVVRPLSPKSCQVNYVTYGSPGGQLPVWLANKATQVLVPKMVKRFHKACLKYAGWKKRHNAHFKPWLFPEQMPIERLNLALCIKNPLDERGVTTDESQVQEFDLISTNILNEDDD
ncbi:START domain-containing protein 10-like [Pollicipes pollicipes]|uniref:START domain-containing protein 10-like n=1 Tax=Pollicipes pollicipes TaxID=41117 RepID=UPI00188555B6|nr:START domain-containing protein 10-like [Pollicipes pollicipes]